MKKIGLVGGISWVSTIDYYKLINEEVNARLGGLNFAECMIYSLNFADIQAAQWNNAYELLYDACMSLKRSGAEAIVLCANTAHLFADQLQSSVDLPIINLITATADAINSKGLKKVGLLGTKYTMEMDFFKDGLRDKGIDPIVPKEQATRDYIQNTLRDELGKGIFKPETKQAYLDVIREMIDDGAEGIILACTEIPMFISQEDLAVPAFDTTRIHALAAVDFLLSD